MREKPPPCSEPRPPALPPHVEQDQRFFRAYAFLFQIPKDGFVSIDVTNECNMRCTYCYFFEQEHPEALDDEHFLNRLVEMKQDKTMPFLQAVWVGGEPLLRRHLIDKARHHFKWNVIVTNGTIPLPPWDDMTFYVSIDGPKEIHERIRVKHCYDRIKKNITESGVPVTLSMCISEYNAETIEELVEEWRHVPNVKNWTFDFFTPIRELELNVEQWMGFEKRDRIVDRLIAIKRRYPDLVATTEDALRLMHSDSCKSVTDVCAFRERCSAYSPQLERKAQCMLGEKADCDRCGCVVPFYLHTLSHRRTVLKDLARGIGRGLSQARPRPDPS